MVLLLKQKYFFQEVNHNIEALEDEMQKHIKSLLINQAMGNKKKHELNQQLYEAVTSNDYVNVEKLILAGATVIQGNSKDAKLYSDDEDTPLHIAAKKGYLDIVRLLIEHGAFVDSTNRKEQTPLHWAVHNRHVQVIEYLLQFGADINAKENEGDTALAWAIYLGLIDIAQLLLKREAKVNSYNFERVTPLHWAAYKGDLDTIKLLLSYDANIDDVTKAGDTPILCATHNGHVESVQYLLEYAQAKGK